MRDVTQLAQHPVYLIEAAVLLTDGQLEALATATGEPRPIHPPRLLESVARCAAWDAVMSVSGSSMGDMRASSSRTLRGGAASATAKP